MGNDSDHWSLVVIRLKWSYRKWVLDDPMGTGHPVNLRPIGFWKNTKHRNKMRMRITRQPWWWWLENSEMAREFISEYEILAVVSMYWCGFWKETHASRYWPVWPVRPLTSTLSPVTPADRSPSTPSFWLEQRECFGWRNGFCSITFFIYVIIYSPKDWSYQPQLFITSFTEKNPIISHANLVSLHYWFVDLHVNPWTGLFITLHYKRQSEGNTKTDKIGFKVLWLWLDLFKINFHTLLFPMHLITVHLELFITGQTKV